MKPAVEFGDTELWLTDWLRGRLPEWTPFVSNRLVDNGSKFAVIVRDDSGADALVTADRRVGVRCIGHDMIRTSAMARRVAALLRRAAQVEHGNPVAAVGDIRGPYRVNPDDLDNVEYYLTAELVVVGKPILEEE